MNILLPIALIGAIAISSFSPKSKTSKPVSSSTKEKINVGLYKSYGVSPISFDNSKKILENNKDINLSILSSSDIRNGKIDKNKIDVMVFMGGSGSQQGKDLKESGRAIVKDFVSKGGGYFGVCGGSYLALQGAEEFNKLAIVAGENYGDYWQRGIGNALIKTNDGGEVVLHYENGPVFERMKIDGISPYVELGLFESDFYKPSKGTQKGEMPGRPAIIGSKYGKGKIILFSPNPIIGDKETLHPELLINGIKFLASDKTMKSGIKFKEIFGV